jgi:hypothetical protein
LLLEKIEDEGLKPRQSGDNDRSSSTLLRLLVEHFGELARGEDDAG